MPIADGVLNPVPIPRGHQPMPILAPSMHSHPLPASTLAPRAAIAAWWSGRRLLALVVLAAAGQLAAVEIFTGGINNRHDLTLPNAKGWTEVAAQADGFYLHPNGWFDGNARMGAQEHTARAQLLDNFASKRFIVEDSFNGMASKVEGGSPEYGLRHINGMVAHKLSVLSIRPGYRCVGYTPNVGPDVMLAGDPDVLAKRFADATKAVRDLGIPVYWLWTPVSRPELCIKLRAEVAGSGMQRWEYLAVKGKAAGVSFDIPPGHIMQEGGPTKAAVDWYMQEMIPRCRTRGLKSIWLCNTIHSSGAVFTAAVERIIANNAMADIFIPTDFGRYDYPATPESVGGKPNLGSTTGAALWAIKRLQDAPVPPRNQPPAVRLTSPSLSRTLSAPASLALAATASDSDGTIRTVEFLANGRVIATEALAPFAWTWSGIPPGTYAVSARARDNDGALSTSPTVTITVTAPAAFSARINFQPAAAAAPAGWRIDNGAVYGSRGNGLSYGWNADVSATARDRNSATSPSQVEDTLVHLQKPLTPNARWEIAVPNGRYTVQLIAGDAHYSDSRYRTRVEGVLALDATPSATRRWFTTTTAVTVDDGRLSVGNDAGAVNNKLNAIVVTANP